MMKKKRGKSKGLISTWIATFFAVMIITSIIVPAGEDGNIDLPDWVMWLDLFIPTIVTFACKKKFKGEKNESSYLGFVKSGDNYVPVAIVGTNPWIYSFGWSVNRVVDGLYKRQGIVSFGGAVYITLPMFKRVSLDRSSVQGFSILSRRPNTSQYFIRSGKYQVEILYRSGESSVVEVNWKICEMLIRSLREFETTYEETVKQESEDTISSKPEIEKPAHEITDEPVVTKSYYIPVKDRDPMEIIRMMEARFEERYQFAYTYLLNAADCQIVYNQTVKEFSTIELPLMAQVRFEQLCAEYKEKFSVTNPFAIIDTMEGHDFERWCANLLERNGFADVKVTKGSGDQGVDILAVKDGIHYAFQCKCYSSDIGNKSVQEVHAGKSLYRCQVGVVITNRHFTAGAKELAEATGVLLWDRDKLKEMIDSAAP